MWCLILMDLVSFLERVSSPSDHEALAGVMVAHISHLLSVFVLHELSMAVCPKESRVNRSRFAFLAASLHIISPAGIFLSAPYAESSFSFLAFLGLFIYVKTLAGNGSETSESKKRLMVITSGIIFGISTTLRGNGLFSGLLLVYDAIDCLCHIVRSRQIRLGFPKLVTTCFSGVLMACIAAFPQYLAYGEYCDPEIATEEPRPWCQAWIPSIYTWVQEQYWYAPQPLSMSLLNSG